MATVGYERVSTADQNTDHQLQGVATDIVFTDKASGKDTNRPELAQALQYVRAGDVFVVHSMDRLDRNLADLRSIVNQLTSKGVVVKFHKEQPTFTGDDSPMNTLLLNLLGSVAEFERVLIKERQREGIAVAKTKGRYKGGQPNLSPAQADELRGRHAAGEGDNQAGPKVQPQPRVRVQLCWGWMIRTR